MRRSLMYVVLAASLLGGAAGCADDGRPAAPATSPAPATTSSPADQAFPLTVTRRGGFAGVDDLARITADGSAVVTRKGQPPVRTLLPAGTLAELRSLLTAPDFAAQATPSDGSAVCNDGYEYAFVSPSASAFVRGCDAPRGPTLDRTVAIVATLFTA